MGDDAPVALFRDALVAGAPDGQAVLVRLHAVDGKVVNDGAFRLLVLSAYAIRFLQSDSVMVMRAQV